MGTHEKRMNLYFRWQFRHCGIRYVRLRLGIFGIEWWWKFKSPRPYDITKTCIMNGYELLWIPPWRNLTGLRGIGSVSIVEIEEAA